MLTTSLKISENIEIEFELLHIMLAGRPKNKKPFGPYTMPYCMISYLLESEYHIHGKMCDKVIREKEALVLYEGENVTTTYHNDRPVKAIQVVFKITGGSGNYQEIFPRLIDLSDNRNIMELSLKRCLDAYGKQHFDLAKEEFMTVILELLKINSRHKITHYSTYVEHAIEYINQHYLLHPTREAIAKVCQINPMYLSTIFHQETGQSIKEYINRKRILHAKELLAETEDTISEIAEAISMDIFSFSRLFKKISGISPSKYAKLYRF